MKLLRYGMVGGGVGSFIGEAHRRAIQIDNMAHLTAGCFTPGMINYPTVENGLEGVRFIHACLQSSNAGGVWVDV